MKIELSVGWSKKKLLAFILITQAVWCASTIAQDFTADNWLQKGDEFYKNESYDLALRCYEKAIEIDPLEADAWHNKGDVFKELNRSADAEAAFAKANELGYGDSNLLQSAKPVVEISNGQGDDIYDADYIDTLYFEEAGPDGIKGYLVLANKEGEAIASNGIIHITVSANDHNGFDEPYALNKTIIVNTSDFKDSYRPEYKFGRLVLDYEPMGTSYSNQMVIVYVDFTTPNGNVLYENERIWWGDL